MSPFPQERSFGQRLSPSLSKTCFDRAIASSNDSATFSGQVKQTTTDSGIVLVLFRHGVECLGQVPVAHIIAQVGVNHRPPP